MKKICALFMTLVMAMSFVACGEQVRADAELEGKYIAVAGEMWGIVMTMDDLNDFSFELKSGGKGEIVVDGTSSSLKWENDDENITIEVEGEEIIGKRQTDAFVVENMMDLGADITFAKEGTDAADLSNYIPEEDKMMIGVWKSETVTDILGDPVSNMNDDGLSLEFFADYTVNVNVMGNDLGIYPWSNLGTWGSVDDETISLTWDIVDDGLTVSYDGEDYWVFSCTKAE